MGICRDLDNVYQVHQCTTMQLIQEGTDKLLVMIRLNEANSFVVKF